MEKLESNAMASASCVSNDTKIVDLVNESSEKVTEDKPKDKSIAKDMEKLESKPDVLKEAKRILTINRFSAVRTPHV